MPTDSEETTPRPRLIIPGAEPAESAKSRIVLPPGVAREDDERELPEFPRLRPLILMPVRDGERELVVVSDPLGVIEGQPVLAAEALPLLQLLDGSVSVQDLVAALMRETKDLRINQSIRDFIAKLDDMLMLDSPRFEKAYQALRDAYHPLEIRPSVLDGRAYPALRDELTRSLDAHFAEAAKWRDEAHDPVAAADAKPRAVLAPHLDPRRAGATIARAMLEIGDQPRAPLRIVIFGTGHELFSDLFALTRKHFDTPLGRVTSDVAFVDAVALSLGAFAYRSELAHRHEHSIEFMAVYLRHRLGDRPFQIVPILCGGFFQLLEDRRKPREDPAFEKMIEAVREAERSLGGDTLYLAGVDFSHVGPRFGDPGTDDRVRAEIEAHDRKAIAAAEAGNADAWFEAIAAHEDSTRICGFAPVYAMMRCAEPHAGRLLRYGQSIEEDASLVSIAAMVWP